MQKITAVPCGAVSSDRSQMGPATVWQIEFLNRKLTLPPKRLQKPSPDTPFIQVVSSLRSVPVENGRESAGAKHPKEEEESTLLRFEQRPERSDWTQASSRSNGDGDSSLFPALRSFSGRATLASSGLGAVAEEKGKVRLRALDSSPAESGF